MKKMMMMFVAAMMTTVVFADTEETFVPATLEQQEQDVCATCEEEIADANDKAEVVEMVSPLSHRNFQVKETNDGCDRSQEESEELEGIQA